MHRLKLCLPQDAVMQALAATLKAIGEGVAIEGTEIVLSWALLSPHPWRLLL